MAPAIVEVLGRHGRFDGDELAMRLRPPLSGRPVPRLRPVGKAGVRASGPPRASLGPPPTRVSHGGAGSMGNGGAMRVAPLRCVLRRGFGEVVAQARASAEVTHGHPEGQAGAIAVAVAAAWSWLGRDRPRPYPTGGTHHRVGAHPPRARPVRGWSGHRPRASMSRSGRRRPPWVMGTGSRRRTRSRSPSGVPPATSTVSPRRSGRPSRSKATTTRTAQSSEGLSRWPTARVDPGGLA